MAIQLVLIYSPLLVILWYALLLACRFVSGKKYPSTKFYMLSLASENSTNVVNEDDSDLPHRLVAGDTDYECFDSDTDGSTHDGTDFDITY